jgi:hypothetical protein
MTIPSRKNRPAAESSWWSLLYIILCIAFPWITVWTLMKWSYIARQITMWEWGCGDPRACVGGSSRASVWVALGECVWISVYMTSTVQCVWSIKIQWKGHVSRLETSVCTNLSVVQTNIISMNFVLPNQTHTHYPPNPSPFLLARSLMCWHHRDRNCHIRTCLTAPAAGLQRNRVTLRYIDPLQMLQQHNSLTTE